MTATLLTSSAKEALRKTVRGLRTRLLGDLTEQAKGEYQLAVAPDKARLTAAQRGRRRRLEDWLSEQARGASDKADKAGKADKGAKAGKGKTKKDDELQARFFAQAIEQAAHTLLNRLVLVRILEHHKLLAPGAPLVVTGGWKSSGYAAEFVDYAGPLTDDKARGYGQLLDAVFGELALELPGLFGNVGLTSLFPVPADTLRAVVEALNDPALDSAWGDDTTLGWVYQYWNDPERERLDKKIADGGKIEPHEIASKTQMFTERYMVEWLLQNSLGFTWLSICKKNGWTPDAQRVLPDLDARRAEWRTRREAGEVALDALMPIAPGLEEDWKYYVPQPIPDDAVAKAPGSITEVKLLDPACGSGHFLVIAFGLFARMYEEEARHRGQAWSPSEIAQRIVAENLHGIDIDGRAIQIAAAALWLRARLYAPEVRLSRMNLVAPTFRLAALPKDDPARAALEAGLAEMGLPRGVTARLVEGLKGVDYLGTLLRVDREIAALLEEAEREEGPLFAHGAKKKRARLEELVAAFLDAHAAERDLGLRLEGEQLAAGLRFVELVREGRYDVVVGNPPYQGISKTAEFDYVVKNYPRGKADLYAAFLERGLELVREGGLSALLTMRGWMFLGQFTAVRKCLVHEHDLRVLGDVDRGAFEDVPDEVLSTVMSVFRRAAPGAALSLAVQPTPLDDRARDSGRTPRKRAAVLAQVGRYEFDPKGFAVIEGEPIVYWWNKEFLRRYASGSKLGQISPAKFGLNTGDNGRFVRRWWEPARRDVLCVATTQPKPSSCELMWSWFLNGADGASWIDAGDQIVRWQWNGLEVRVLAEHLYGSYSRQIRNERLYWQAGVAFTMVGNAFSGRAHRFRSVIGDMGSSVFPPSIPDALCAMNTSDARTVVSSLNPGIRFQVGDVNRIPVFRIRESAGVFETLEAAFAAHEAGRETSIEFRRPAPSTWDAVQGWAQAAVDAHDDTPLPPYTPTFAEPSQESFNSFAIGVALGRFGESGEGILDAAPPTALPAGILFVGPSEAYPDSLTHPALAPLHAAWETFKPASGKKPLLRDWLRKDFFAYHKSLYENRPIYFPLSSEKKSFVAWVSIHRFSDATLSTLLADHLNPVLRQLDAEIRDANSARASSDKKQAIAANKAFESAKRLRDELADFLAKVTACAERGAPPTDAACPAREVDATFAMDLDDGVMINSAALWPLLAPQWSDPKKWWKQLCLAEGRKDYDWAHLAKRYFPTRVDAKCKEDPSLGVAHQCFWRYHPEKAFAWELRLQDEIRPDFTIDEPGSDEARAAFLRDEPAKAEAARDKERIRRERKAAKQDDEAASSVRGEGEGEGDDGAAEDAASEDDDG